jgi:hypothetical protein
LRMPDGLNTITLRGVIGTAFPVFGLRPMRGPLVRTTNDPNDESFTTSPRSKQSEISLDEFHDPGRLRPRQADPRVDRFDQIDAGHGCSALSPYRGNGRRFFWSVKSLACVI